MRGSERGNTGNSSGSIDRQIDVPHFTGGPVNGSGMYYQNPRPYPPQEPVPPEKPKGMTKKQRNRVYGRAAYVFSALFLSLIGYIIYFNVKLTDQLNNNPYNSKLDAMQEFIVRGGIYSADGEILAATNVYEDGSEERVYPMGSLYAHITGYNTNGKAGLEAIYSNDMMRSHQSIVEQVLNQKDNIKLRGDNLILTIDSNLQEAASRAMGAYRGAAVVMEAKTGKILAMVSKPDFDPNAIEENWEILTSDDSNSPLLNRATQGLYPPGSTFKILTTLEYMRENPNSYQQYEYNCEGTKTKEDVTIKCYDYEVHGYEDLRASFQNSCNTSFANIGLSLDMKKYAELCDDLMFNGKLPTTLPYSSSQFKLNRKSSYGEIMTTAIGQGDTLVSPFHMALITAAVANDGVLMYPYLADRVENVDGITVKRAKPMQYKRLMSAKESAVLKDYMTSVVESGTARYLSGRSYTVAGKTGSAEYEADGNTGKEENFSTHSWFVGFSNVNDPDIVVSVIAEDGGTGSSAAVPIAGAIFDAYYYYGLDAQIVDVGNGYDDLQYYNDQQSYENSWFAEEISESNTGSDTSWLDELLNGTQYPIPDSNENHSSADQGNQQQPAGQDQNSVTDAGGSDTGQNDDIWINPEPDQSNQENDGGIPPALDDVGDNSADQNTSDYNANPDVGGDGSDTSSAGGEDIWTAPVEVGEY